MARAQAERASPAETAGGRSAPRDKALSAYALAQLAQREYSRAELRRKLLARASAHIRRRQPEGSPSGPAPVSAVPRHRAPASTAAVLLQENAPVGAATAAERVNAVLDWLEANRYLSTQRFIESRVRTRSERFGNMRIRQELAQHGLSLPAQAEATLQSSEFDRAHAVWARKFKLGSGSPADTAKQARFLAGRGFSSDVIWRVLRSSHSSESDVDELVAPDSRATLPR